MGLTNNNGETSLGGLMEVVHNLKDATSLSLTQYTRDCIVSSRVFIDNTLHSESDGALPLVFNSLMNTYTALIMTGMDMNQYVTSTKKVRDMMSVVATENYGSMIEEEETLDSSLLISSFFGTPTMGIDYDDLKNAEFDNVSGNHASGNSSSVVDTEGKTGAAPIQSRVINVKFGSNSVTGDGQVSALSANLLVQLAPLYVTPGVIKQFLESNFKPNFSQRLMQYQAGEITAKDLALGLDIRRKRMKAMRNDKSGMLREMEERRENSLANAWLKYATVTPGRQNIANTILIYEKNTFNEACNNVGMKVTNYRQRQEFFNKTFSMILVIVDPDYNKVKMYYNGIEQCTECTFDQLKKDSKNDKMDITAYMKAYAQGFAPKY